MDICFHFPWDIPRNKRSRSYGKYMFTFLINQDREFLLNQTTKQCIYSLHFGNFRFSTIKRIEPGWEGKNFL